MSLSFREVARQIERSDPGVTSEVNLGGVGKIRMLKNVFLRVIVVVVMCRGI